MAAAGRLAFPGRTAGGEPGGAARPPQGAGPRCAQIPSAGGGPGLPQRTKPSAQPSPRRKPSEEAPGLEPHVSLPSLSSVVLLAPSESLWKCIKSKVTCLSENDDPTFSQRTYDPPSHQKERYLPTLKKKKRRTSTAHLNILSAWQPWVFQGVRRVYLSIYLGQMYDNFFFIAHSCSFQEVLVCRAQIVETKTPHDSTQWTLI